MANDQIEQKVREILSKKLNIELKQITPESRLAEDLGMDSFGAVELMFEVEEAFGLAIPDSDIEHIRTVKDIVVYVTIWIEKNPKS